MINLDFRDRQICRIVISGLTLKIIEFGKKLTLAKIASLSLLILMFVKVMLIKVDKGQKKCLDNSNYDNTLTWSHAEPTKTTTNQMCKNI